jgi:8-amino-7-oxononanoate synthase
MTPDTHAARHPGHVPGAASAPSLSDFYDCSCSDLFEKCNAFAGFIDEAKRSGVYQSQYRVTLVGALDHRIRVEDPFHAGAERELVCFDSNSYLGLHLHPRVLAAVRTALDAFGVGTPSAQLLAGTSSKLRELEETVAAFHAREDAIVFPSGYAANVGALTALLRPRDVVFRDRFSHASIHDGCRWSGAACESYPHLDLRELERRALARRSHPLGSSRGATPGGQDGDSGGALIVTDGVFSMHGRVAPLRELRSIADRADARLMVDEAHAIGVIGPDGRGLEAAFGMPGAIDVLMGTFSKAPGAVGGYVCGSRALIDYLRFFARASMFTAALPAATCAGITEALRVMDSEPEHRERLWRNTRRFWTRLRDEGLDVPELESPIVTVLVGADSLLWRMGRGLFDAGIKCGTVSYPAVPRGEGILRFAVNARHTDEELDHSARTLSGLARRFDLLKRSHADIVELDARAALREGP